MDSDFSNNTNKQMNIANELYSSYIKNVDENKDGKISLNELQTFYNNNPNADSSIFSEILSFANELSAMGDDSDKMNVFNDEFDFAFLLDKFKKDTRVNIEDLKDVNIETFAEMGSEEDLGKTENNFWNSISEFGFDNIFANMDTDQDGALSDEELDILSSADGENGNLSLYDLQQIIDSFETTSEDSTVNPEEETEAPQEIDNADGAASSSHSGGTQDSGYTPSTPTVDTKTQLADNLTTAQNDFNTAKSNYLSVLDGNINDANVNQKKQEMDSAYDNWQTELEKEDSTLAKNIDATKTSIDDINNQIAQNDKEIFNNEVNLSNCTSAYDIAKEHTANLKSKKGELESACSGLDSSDPIQAKRIAAYNQHIHQIELEIAAAERAESVAKNAMEDAEKALQDSKDVKTDLEQQLIAQEEVLAGYMDEFESLAKNNPTLKQLQNDYETKKSEYETALKEYKENLKNEAMSKQENVVSKQKEYSTYLNNEEVSKYDSALVNYDSNFADVLNKYLLEGAGDHSKSDCGGAVRRAMYKTVKELYGEEAAAIFKNGYGVIGGDWDNQYLDNSPFFTDITDMYSPEEIESMLVNGELKGAVINYERYTGGNSGHVEGVTVEGLTSDYTRPHDYFRSGSNLGKSEYSIYLPVTPTREQIEEWIALMASKKAAYDSPIL